MRKRGYRWTTSRVAELERGKVAPVLSTVVVLSDALSELAETDVPSVAWLISTPGLIEISPGVIARGPNFVASLFAKERLHTNESRKRIDELLALADAGEDAAKWLRGPQWSRERVRDVIVNTSLADERAARKLKLSLVELATLADGLWNHALSWEREWRWPDEANAQTGGRITRELIDEARQYVLEHTESHHA
jgi:hypothetical protein